MALLRAELQGRSRSTQQKRAGGLTGAVSHGIYDGIVDTQSDLYSDCCARFDAGSIMLCLADKQLYVKGGDGQWIGPMI